MKTEEDKIVPELIFVKYKGVPAPWEVIAQAKRFGFKCKKYANWSAVHVSERSREVLKQVGDSLIDSSEFDIAEFSEMSKVWERVQRWAKDKEGFLIEPDILPEYEKISRLTAVGSSKPDVVDLIIDEFGFDSDSISIDDRWTLFLAICSYNLYQSNSRYKSLPDLGADLEIQKITWNNFIRSVRAVVVELYLQLGFDISNNDSPEAIVLFVKELGCTYAPEAIERNSKEKRIKIPTVWLEKYEGGDHELVKFQNSEGNVIVKLNKLNKTLRSNSALSKLLSDEEFWNLIGRSLHSHINQMEEIQTFFDTLAKHIRLRE